MCYYSKILHKLFHLSKSIVRYFYVSKVIHSYAMGPRHYIFPRETVFLRDNNILQENFHDNNFKNYFSAPIKNVET